MRTLNLSMSIRCGRLPSAIRLYKSGHAGALPLTRTSFARKDNFYSCRAEVLLCVWPIPARSAKVFFPRLFGCAVGAVLGADAKVGVVDPDALACCGKRERTKSRTKDFASGDSVPTSPCKCVRSEASSSNESRKGRI